MRIMGRSKGRARRAVIDKAYSRGAAAAFASANMSAQPRTVALGDAINALTGGPGRTNGLVIDDETRWMMRDPRDDVAFGPINPLRPDAIDPVRPDTKRPEPRLTEYPVAWNLPGSADAPMPWATLRAAAQNVDIMRRCISVRQEQLQGLDWSITLDDQTVQGMHAASAGDTGREDIEAELRRKLLPEIDRLTEFWRNPWKANGVSFEQWVNGIMEDHLVLDAVAIYPRMTYGGQLSAFELIDATTIKLLVDYRGARPVAPFPAFQQILYGFPRAEFGSCYATDGEDGVKPVEGMAADQLFYFREQYRSFTPYGYSAVAQALISARLYLRRQGWMLAEYDDGSTPLTFLVPDATDATMVEKLTPRTRRQWEDSINAELAGQTRARNRMKVLMPGMTPHQMQGVDERYKPDYDMHLIKMLAGHFGVTSTGLGFSESKGLGNSGLHEGQADVQQAATTKPDKRMIERIVNELMRTYQGAPAELRFKFTDPDVEDQAAEDAAADAQRARGTITLNDDRKRIGKSPFTFPEADMPLALLGTGWVPIEGMAERAQQQADAEQVLVEDQLATGEQQRELADAEASMPAEDIAKVAEARALITWRRKRNGRAGRPFVCKSLEPDDFGNGVPADVDFAEWEWQVDDESIEKAFGGNDNWRTLARDHRGRWVKRGSMRVDALGPSTPDKPVIASLRADASRRRAAAARPATDPSIAREITGSGIVISGRLKGMPAAARQNPPSNAHRIKVGAIGPDGTVTDDQGRAVGALHSGVTPEQAEAGGWLHVDTNVPGASGGFRTVSAWKEPAAVDVTAGSSAADKLRRAELMYGTDRSKWPAKARQDAAKLERQLPVSDASSTMDGMTTPEPRTDRRPRIETYKGRKLKVQKHPRLEGRLLLTINGEMAGTPYAGRPEQMDKELEQLRRDIDAADLRRHQDPNAYPEHMFRGAPKPTAEEIEHARAYWAQENADRAALNAPAEMPPNPAVKTREQRVAELNAGMAAAMSGGAPVAGGMAERVMKRQEQAVRDVVTSLQDAPGGWVAMADVRRKLEREHGMDRGQQDAALRRLATTGDRALNTAPEDNQKTLTDADHAAAVDFGAGPQHVISLDPPRRSVLDTVRESSEQAAAASAVTDSVPGLREGVARQQAESPELAAARRVVEMKRDYLAALDAEMKQTRREQGRAADYQKDRAAVARKQVSEAEEDFVAAGGDLSTITTQAQRQAASDASMTGAHSEPAHYRQAREWREAGKTNTPDAPSAAPADHPQKAAYDKLLDGGMVRHKQARQIVEQMEAHGWKLTDQNPMVSVTQWEAPDGRKMAVQFLTSDKPKFYPGGNVLGGNPSYKAALAHVVTPTHEEVGGPNVRAAAARVSPELGKRVDDALLRGGSDDHVRRLDRAQRELVGYGSTPKRPVADVVAGLRSDADRLDATAQSNAEHHERTGGFGESSIAVRQRREAGELRAIADVVDQQAAERAAYEAEVERRAGLPLDIRPTSRSTAKPTPAKRAEAVAASTPTTAPAAAPSVNDMMAQQMLSATANPASFGQHGTVTHAEIKPGTRLLHRGQTTVEVLESPRRAAPDSQGRAGKVFRVRREDGGVEGTMRVNDGERVALAAPKGGRVTAPGNMDAAERRDYLARVRAQAAENRKVIDARNEARAASRPKAEATPATADARRKPESIGTRPAAAVGGTLAQRQRALSEAVTGGVVGERKLGGGQAADTKLVTLADGTKAVHKVTTETQNDHSPRDQVDAEELAGEVAAALGVRTPAMVRTGPTSAYQEFMPGQPGKSVHGRDIPASVLDSDDGVRLGLLDHITANSDRHGGNWLVDGDGSLTGIDNGMAFDYRATMGTHNPFGKRHFEDDANPLSPADVARVRERLAALKPRFTAMKRGAWHKAMMARLDEVARGATGTRDLIL